MGVGGGTAVFGAAGCGEGVIEMGAPVGRSAGAVAEGDGINEIVGRSVGNEMGANSEEDTFWHAVIKKRAASSRIQIVDRVCSIIMPTVHCRNIKPGLTIPR